MVSQSSIGQSGDDGSEPGPADSGNEESDTGPAGSRDNESDSGRSDSGDYDSDSGPAGSVDDENRTASLDGEYVDDQSDCGNWEPPKSVYGLENEDLPALPYRFDYFVQESMMGSTVQEYFVALRS